MWANAQRDGCPADYRWRPLFNTAQFGWCPLLECRAVKGKGKEEYLYSAFLAKVVHSKRSGMDHTVLPANNTMPAFPSRAFTRCHHHSTEAADIQQLTTHLSTRKNERLSWPSWLTYSGWFTHISGHPSGTGGVQDSESTPAKDRCSTAGPRNQLTLPRCKTRWNLQRYPKLTKLSQPLVG